MPSQAHATPGHGSKTYLLTLCRRDSGRSLTWQDIEVADVFLVVTGKLCLTAFVVSHLHAPWSEAGAFALPGRDCSRSRNPRVAGEFVFIVLILVLANWLA